LVLSIAVTTVLAFGDDSSHTVGEKGEKGEFSLSKEENDPFYERNHRERKHDHQLERRERRRDDSDTKTHHPGREQHLEDRLIEAQIKSALSDDPLFVKTIPVKIHRTSYQLRCTRNATQGLSSTTILATNFNDTSANRTIGPILILGTTSSQDVTLDSFDGNNDGHLDVLEARDFWEHAANTPAAQAQAIDKFTIAIRNRATVNGGSIELRSIVLTGRHVVHTKKKNTVGAFFQFNAATTLITPCFPMTTEPGYQIVLYASGLLSNTFNQTLLVSQAVTTAGAESLPTINLVRRTGINAGTVEGECTFQLCTQHSYFQ